MKKLSVLMIRTYRRYLSPFLGHHCRFFPSCSEYAEQALSQKGFWLGSWLIIRRLLRCHPFHVGGWDPLESRTES